MEEQSLRNERTSLVIERLQLINVVSSFFILFFVCLFFDSLANDLNGLECNNITTGGDFRFHWCLVVANKCNAKKNK